MYRNEVLLSGMSGKELGASSFVFDANASKFLIGENSVSIGEYPSYSSNRGSAITEKDTLIITYVGLFGLKNMYEFLETVEQVDEIRESTVNTMVDVFEQAHGEPIGAINRKPDSLFGFNVDYLRPGHVRLNVLGNCACIGVDPMSYFVDELEMQNGHMHFVEHNIDMETQRVALHAGLGHIAKLVNDG